MAKSLRILPLLLVVSLTACGKTSQEEGPVKQEGTGYYFYTEVAFSLYSETDEPIREIKKICSNIDVYADSYAQRTVTSVYDLNHTNEKIEISEGLYNLLNAAKEASKVAPNFNPLVGSLSDKWKESLEKKEVLADSIIQEELTKMNNSSYEISKEDNKYYAQRFGEATLDLGAITKGYSLDLINDYLTKQEITGFLINCGSSSVLLGANEHPTTKKDSQTFTVALRDAPSKLFEAYNCVISSSGNDIQGVKINNTMYSHIINPNTGSAIMENDAVIVLTERNKGYLGDALSTSLMMNTVEEIKQIEEAVGCKTIVIKNGNIVYSHKDINIIK